MSETAEALDRAKGKLQSEANEPTVRSKDPSYHVFKLTAEEGKFHHLTAAGPVKASSRKAAIAQASAAFNKIEAEAETYLVIAEKEFKLITRKVKTVIEETFE